MVTALRYTKHLRFTVLPYTKRCSKSLRSFRVLAANCTKLDPKLKNNTVDAFEVGRGGAA